MIRSLTSLRFIFIVMVFFSHVVWGEHQVFDFGGDCGVAFFFMLSGFCLAEGYSRCINDGEFHAGQFMRKRLLKVYPLHIVLLVAVLLLNSYSGIQGSLLKDALCLLLLQSWIPDLNYCYYGNGVAWFLSDMVFFYAVFQLLFRWLNKSSMKTTITAMAVVIALYAAVAWLVPENLATPVLYVSPLTRSLDFAWGILLSRVFHHCRITGKSKVLTCTLDFLPIALVAVVYCLYQVIPLQYTCSLLFLPLSAAVIICYALAESTGEEGIVSRLLQTRLMTRLGEVSFEFYMIHGIVIRLCHHAFGSSAISYAEYAAICLLLTLVLALTLHSVRELKDKT